MSGARKTENFIQLTEAEAALLDDFYNARGAVFKGGITKHANEGGENFWIYRPVKGIHGASCKFGTLADFLSSLSAPSPALASTLMLQAG